MRQVAAPDWSAIDTVLLDMDGTLLDLHYDNTVWNEQVPRAYAKHAELDLETASSRLLSHMREILGSIQFYSFEYWNQYTGLDLTEIHRTQQHLVEWRPNAREFLQYLRGQGKHVVLATNAHPESIKIKDAEVDICNAVDAVYSSNEFGAPKESGDFWTALQARCPFDPARTLFVDDNEPVLEAAASYGIAHLWCVITPDSARPGRTGLRYPAFDDFRELCPSL